MEGIGQSVESWGNVECSCGGLGRWRSLKLFTHEPERRVPRWGRVIYEGDKFLKKSGGVRRVVGLA